MKLMFIGADHEVTGSCHYLEAAGKHILVDRGMEQGINPFGNAELPVQEAPAVRQGIPGENICYKGNRRALRHHAA